MPKIVVNIGTACREALFNFVYVEIINAVTKYVILCYPLAEITKPTHPTMEYFSVTLGFTSS